MNTVNLVGRITKDIDLRYSPNGTAIASFTVAVNRTFKQDGQPEADFINCVTFKKQAENLANYMKKGSQIGVVGRIQTRTYENNEGRTIFVTEVVADSVQFLEPRDATRTPSTYSEDGPKTKPNFNSDPFSGDSKTIDISDDSLPF